MFDTDAGFQGFNLYVYCGNHPINRIDISGADSEKLEDLDLDDDEIQERGGGGGTHGGIVKTANNSGYQFPKGGGGVSRSITVGDKTINFGHGGRHLQDTGLTTDLVENQIAHDVVTQHVPTTHSQNYYIDIQGISFTYRAMMYQTNRINIGTYFITRE